MQMKMQLLGSTRYQILRRFFYSDQGCVVKISIGFGIVKKPFSIIGILQSRTSDQKPCSYFNDLKQKDKSCKVLK